MARLKTLALACISLQTFVQLPAQFLYHPRYALYIHRYHSRIIFVRVGDVSYSKKVYAYPGSGSL